MIEALTETNTAAATAIALDPGNTQTGWVLFREDADIVGGMQLLAHGTAENKLLRRTLRKAIKPAQHIALALEMPRARGMLASNELFETCVQIGRFLATWPGDVWTYVCREDVKRHICGTPVAKDPNVRQALIDRFGGNRFAIGGHKCPTCKGRKLVGLGKKRGPCQECNATGYDVPPGQLHDVATHAWPALGIACYWTDRHEIVHSLLPSMEMKQAKAKAKKAKEQAALLKGQTKTSQLMMFQAKNNKGKPISNE